MDPNSQFIVPTIIDVPELIVTNEDIDFDDPGGGSSRSLWLNKLQFVASALGYTAGLGSLWRFPYLCYKHAGGAFLIAHFIILIVIGLPLVLMELAFGQYANEGPITIWRISPAFEGIGYTMCLISASAAVYYNILNAYSLRYLLGSVTFGDLPWAKCDNSYNTQRCYLKPDKPTIIDTNCTNINNSTAASNTSPTSNNMTTATINNANISIIYSSNCKTNLNPNQFERIINTTDEVTLPTSEYFHNNVVSISESMSDVGGLNFDLIILVALSSCLMFVLAVKDVRPQGRLAVALLLMPYFSLAALLAGAMSQEDTQAPLQGLAYLLSPQWDKFQNIDVWSDAASQVFFSLSPCWGGLITLASMNKFHNNFHSDALLVSGINYVTSICAAIVCFAILGQMSAASGINIAEVVESGPGFGYMVYSDGLSKLPLAWLQSVIFFATLLVLGFISQLTAVETVLTTIVDTWPHKLRYRKPLVLAILCSGVFLLTLSLTMRNGFYIVELMDVFTGTYAAMIVGIAELIAVAWVYGIDNFMQDIDDMISMHRSLPPSRSYWYFLWRYLSPSLLFAIVLLSFTDLGPSQYRNYQLPDSAFSSGWILTILSVSLVPAMAFVRFLLSPSGSFIEKLTYLCRPSEDWAPSSYISGPKLLNRRTMAGTRELRDTTETMYSSQHTDDNDNMFNDDDDDQESNEESNEDLKTANGKPNYIIPEDEDDTDTGLITNETNV